MKMIEQSIEVDAPLRKVYNQWTQFEEFPEFMEGIEKVHQLDDKRLHWVANIGGKHEEWDAEIQEQVPDQRIAWRSITGRQSDGNISFEKVAENKTRIRAAISYEPEGAMEKIGDAMGIVSARVKGDLKRFKEFVERQTTESAGWRGEIHGGQVSPDAGTPRSKRLHGDGDTGL